MVKENKSIVQNDHILISRTSGTLKVTYVKNLILAKPIIHAEWGSTQHQYGPEKEKKWS